MSNEERREELAKVGLEEIHPTACDEVHKRLSIRDREAISKMVLSGDITKENMYNVVSNLAIKAKSEAINSPECATKSFR
jgi:hypothetical protein